MTGQARTAKLSNALQVMERTSWSRGCAERLRICGSLRRLLAFVLSGTAPVDMQRYLNGGGNAVRHIALEREPCATSIQSGQAGADVGKPDAISSAIRHSRKACASVRYRDAQYAVVRCSDNADAAASALWIESMLDGVLNQRQQHHGWKSCREKLMGDRNPEPEPSAHADLLRLQVGPREFDFSAQCGAVSAHLRHRGAQVTTEAAQHRAAAR